MVRITLGLSAEMIDTMVYRSTFSPSGVRLYAHSRVTAVFMP